MDWNVRATQKSPACGAGVWEESWGKGKAAQISLQAAWVWILCKEHLFSPLFLHKGNCGLEKFRNLLKFSWLVGGRMRRELFLGPHHRSLPPALWKSANQGGLDPFQFCQWPYRQHKRWVLWEPPFWFTLIWMLEKTVHFFRVLRRRWKDSISSLKRFLSVSHTPHAHTQNHLAQICHNTREGTGNQAWWMHDFHRVFSVWKQSLKLWVEASPWRLDFHSGLQHKGTWDAGLCGF